MKFDSKWFEVNMKESKSYFTPNEVLPEIIKTLSANRFSEHIFSNAHGVVENNDFFCTNMKSVFIWRKEVYKVHSIESNTASNRIGHEKIDEIQLMVISHHKDSYEFGTDI